MKIASTAALLLLLAAPAVHAKPRDPAGLGRALATKLVARKQLAPKTHTTDFGSDALGCITLTSWELRDFGYRGHAFLCEEGTTSEVLGAVLNRSGSVRCYISGEYIGDGCYDFDICEVPETACVE
jgi:hypothetical protein